MNHFDGLFKELVKKLKAMKIDETYPFTLDKTNYEKNRTGNAIDSLRFHFVEVSNACQKTRRTVTTKKRHKKALADLGGGVRDARPPLGVQILSISCSFRENLACSRPPWRVHAPPRENPGSATEKVI